MTAKPNMYAICSQALNQEPQRAWHFEELLDLVVNAELGTRQELKPKLYANMQVWASQKKIVRGAERQTFMANTGAAPVDKPVIEKPIKVMSDKQAKEVKVVKPLSFVVEGEMDAPKVIGQVAAKKLKKGEVDVNAVVKQLYDILGQAINRNRNNAWAIQFDSPEYTAAWGIERYKTVFGGKMPSAWAYEINITFGYVTVWFYA